MAGHRKRRINSRVVCIGLVILLPLLLFLVSLRPDAISAVSPDNQFTARVTMPNSLGIMNPFIGGKMRRDEGGTVVQTELIQNATGKRVVVDKRLAVGDEFEEQHWHFWLFWHPDGQSFTYVYKVHYSLSNSERLYTVTYRVQRGSLVAHAINDNTEDKRLKSVLTAKLKSSDEQERQKAKQVLEAMLR